MSTPARLEAAIDRLRRARVFTRQFLPDLTEAEWWWSPPQFTTHVAWQVGHLAEEHIRSDAFAPEEPGGAGETLVHQERPAQAASE